MFLQIIIHNDVKMSVFHDEVEIEDFEYDEEEEKVRNFEMFFRIMIA